MAENKNYQRVLIVVKKTNFQLHGDNLRQQLKRGRFNNEASYGKLEDSHREHMNCLAEIEGFLNSQGCEFEVLRRENLDIEFDRFDLVMTLGGDGTLLSVARKLVGTESPPIVGIRSSSDSVGFICGIDFHCALAEVKRVFLDQNFKPKEISRLEVQIDPSSGAPWISAPVLNDVLYCNAHPAATSRYVLKLNGRGERQKSSGIWVSTALGSTAAMMAAGGVAQSPDDEMLQYRVREPYTHDEVQSQLLSGFFNGRSELLEVSNLSESAIVAMDGIHGEYKLSYGDIIRVQRSRSIRMYVRSKS